MKTSKLIILSGLTIFPTSLLADQIGSGIDDPFNGNITCDDNCTSPDTESSDVSLLDALLDLFILGEDTESSE